MARMLFARAPLAIGAVAIDLTRVFLLWRRGRKGRPTATDALLLEDGTSILLLEDNTSQLMLG